MPFPLGNPDAAFRREGNGDLIDFAATEHRRDAGARACATADDPFDWAPQWAAARAKTMPVEARRG